MLSHYPYALFLPLSPMFALCLLAFTRSLAHSHFFTSYCKYLQNYCIVCQSASMPSTAFWIIFSPSSVSLTLLLIVCRRQARHKHEVSFAVLGFRLNSVDSFIWVIWMICIICTRLCSFTLMFSFSSLFLDSFAVFVVAFARTRIHVLHHLHITQNRCTYLCVRDMKRGSSQCEHKNKTKRNSEKGSKWHLNRAEGKEYEMNGEKWKKLLMMSQRNWKGRYFRLRLPKQRYYSVWNVVCLWPQYIYHRSQRKHIDYSKQTQLKHIVWFIYSPVDNNRNFPSKWRESRETPRD